MLFLNYLKTAYGSNIFEVILPPGYNFKVINDDIKDIVTYEYTTTFIQPIKEEIMPIRNINYFDPQIKKIKTYLINIV